MKKILIVIFIATVFVLYYINSSYVEDETFVYYNEISESIEGMHTSGHTIVQWWEKLYNARKGVSDHEKNTSNSNAVWTEYAADNSFWDLEVPLKSRSYPVGRAASYVAATTAPSQSGDQYHSSYHYTKKERSHGPGGGGELVLASGLLQGGSNASHGFASAGAMNAMGMRNNFYTTKNGKMLSSASLDAVNDNSSLLAPDNLVAADGHEIDAPVPSGVYVLLLFVVLYGVRRRR